MLDVEQVCEGKNENSGKRETRSVKRRREKRAGFHVFAFLSSCHLFPSPLKKKSAVTGLRLLLCGWRYPQVRKEVDVFRLPQFATDGLVYGPDFNVKATRSAFLFFSDFASVTFLSLFRVF